jgi:phospholipase/carboxylesterase
MAPTFDRALRHRFVPGTDPAQPPLLLLHGTGGNEDDLLPLGRLVAPGAALLSPRGAVEENGMPRFFRRLAEGVFDEADLKRRTAELAHFIQAAREQYGIAAPVAIGFSNGANIAAALLMLHPGVLAGAVLLRAMAPFRLPPAAALPSTPILLLSGVADPIVPAENAARLAAQLDAAGAEVTHRTLPGGHGLSQGDVEAISAWLKGQAR